MGFSVQPIDSGKGKRAPLIPMPFGGFRTPFVYEIFDSTESGLKSSVDVLDINTLKINAAGDGVSSLVNVYFGFIAASTLKFNITALREEANNAFDALDININNVIYYSTETEGVSGGIDEYKDFSDTVNIILNADYMKDNACGAMCKITFATIDQYYNDGVFYQIEFTAE